MEEINAECGKKSEKNWMAVAMVLSDRCPKRKGFCPT